MEYGFSVLMLIFGAALFLYAVILYFSKDEHLIPRSYASKKKGPKYAQQIARVVLLTSLAPIASGIVGLRTEGENLWPLFILLSGFVVMIGAGVQMLKDEDNDKEIK